MIWRLPLLFAQKNIFHAESEKKGEKRNRAGRSVCQKKYYKEKAEIQA
jgi:hypothetical protein